MEGKQGGILIQGALHLIGHGRRQLFAGPLSADGFQGAGLGFGQQDPFHGPTIIGMVAVGVAETMIDVHGMVAFFELEDGPGMEASIFAVTVFEAVKERFGMLTQGEELFADRL